MRKEEGESGGKGIEGKGYGSRKPPEQGGKYGNYSTRKSFFSAVVERTRDERRDAIFLSFGRKLLGAVCRVDRP